MSNEVIVLEDSSDHVDVAFPISGKTLPLDHGFALFAALSRVLPALHGAKDWGVHSVLGQRDGDTTLGLTERSRVILRIPTPAIGQCLPLLGAKLEVDGHRIQLGSPRLDRLRSAAAIKARLVTIKGYFENEEVFRDGVMRSLGRFEGLGMDPERVDVTVGRRRVVRIHDKRVVGFALGLNGLEPSTSLAIQRAGIGGRRRMGAGVFVPTGRRG